MRSYWKLPYFKLKSWNIELKKTANRHQVILPFCVNKIISVYQGTSFKPLLLTTDMLGHKLGEFAHSRIIFVHKRKQRAKLKAKAEKLAAKARVKAQKAKILNLKKGKKK